MTRHDPTSHPHRPALKPPQFGVTTLLWVTAGFAAVFAVGAAVGPYAAFALSLLLLILLAHIAGNVIGTQLRNNGNTPVAHHHEVIDEHHRPVRHQRAEAHHYAPASRLSESHRLGWVMLIGTVFFALGGGYFGLWMAIDQTLTLAAIPSVAASVVAFAALGAFLGFMLSSFLRVALSAWWHAHQDPGKRS